ncbi:ABC transporter substrate-binding protein [Synechococcus sp. Nb3U1]|uniref:ABC transporter substrate-binding protein n=1 Tax=Synechococcus sp. Nb3U1 TaxID=1914529 RepID=UPI001F2866F6|nr:ABC transporter substrate-binding protein [Synechococcus sp. Nb3U1]
MLPRLASATTTLTFQLDWKYNAQFAGLFLAEAEGLYAASNLSVQIREWSDGLNVINAVAEGTVDMACAEQNLIIAAQAAGAPVKAVATMFHASPYGLMTVPEAALESLTDLVGKRVGVHVDGIKVMELVKGVNGITDIDVMEIPYGDKFDRVISGEFAAVQCYVIDEPIGVAAKYGFEPKVLRLSEHGFLSTAQTIVASERLLTEKPEVVRAFLAATFEGWARALADKPRTAALVVERFVPEGSPYKDVAYQTRTLELLEPYVRGKGEPLGVIDAEVWAEAARLMLAYDIVSALPDLQSSLAPGFIS